MLRIVPFAARTRLLCRRSSRVCGLPYGYETVFMSSERKVAAYAGVTPALVTYYFPERDDLIEAVTLPIIDALVSSVENCLTRARDARGNLLEALVILLEYYARDAAIIDLFALLPGLQIRHASQFIAEDGSRIVEVFRTLAAAEQRTASTTPSICRRLRSACARSSHDAAPRSQRTIFGGAPSVRRRPKRSAACC